MTRLLTWPKTQNLLLLVLLLGAIIVGFMFTFQVLNRSLAPYTIVAFEFAWTPAQAQTMMHTWGEAGNNTARQSLWLDFSFIPAYALGMAALTLLAARALAGRWQTLGLWLLFAPFAAGIFDALENINLLDILDTAPNVSASTVAWASGSATIKFSLLALCLLYWFAALIIRRRQRTT